MYLSEWVLQSRVTTYHLFDLDLCLYVYILSYCIIYKEIFFWYDTKLVGCILLPLRQ